MDPYVCDFYSQFILLFALVDYSTVTYGDYVYPGWVDAVGWILALSSIIFIPGVMIYKVYKEDDGDTVLEVIIPSLISLGGLIY